MIQIGRAKAIIAELSGKHGLSRNSPVVLSEDRDPPRRQRYNLGNLLMNLEEYDEWKDLNSETKDGWADPIIRIGVARNRAGRLALLLVVDPMLGEQREEDS